MLRGVCGVLRVCVARATAAAPFPARAPSGASPAGPSWTFALMARPRRVHIADELKAWVGGLPPDSTDYVVLEILRGLNVPCQAVLHLARPRTLGEAGGKGGRGGREVLRCMLWTLVLV